jgi:hypothetical protein
MISGNPWTITRSLGDGGTASIGLRRNLSDRPSLDQIDLIQPAVGLMLTILPPDL